MPFLQKLETCTTDHTDMSAWLQVSKYACCILTVSAVGEFTKIWPYVTSLITFYVIIIVTLL